MAFDAREEDGEGRRRTIQGRSGSVALPRTKLVLATATAFLEAPALRAERAALEVRKSVADIFRNMKQDLGDAVSKEVGVGII